VLKLNILFFSYIYIFGKNSKNLRLFRGNRRKKRINFSTLVYLQCYIFLGSPVFSGMEAQKTGCERTYARSQPDLSVFFPVGSGRAIF